ncbi:MAG: GIY-YIG nuclease family protein [Anaerovibrio sp.]|uniref:GIY-YIG nuclease family protein n=1 Tax=Anaerovibrio sp. TaxID=1872532 RepID=UPI00261639DE|nr:GIY-YIG nuclease family protein [Anaerovibrio sp.]MDD7677794.1 GIY-YIG nuclease family protein [Anaerovibrio sp.]
MILLNDLLGLDANEIKRTRLKLNIPEKGNNPLDLYKSNPDEINVNWFLWHNSRRYFHTGQIAICLVRISQDEWLLTTIKNILSELETDDGVGYEAEEIDKYKGFFGRVVVKYHNTVKWMGKVFENVMDELEVLEILPEAYKGDEFPGYENVCLDYSMLKTIVERDFKGWRGALKNQKAVYLITDKSNGKLYVGSATAENGMLWQRWADYAVNGHGGNKVLRDFIRREGIEYIEANFQYSILEHYNGSMDDEYILERESWWKNILCSRKFGYNLN